MRRTPSRQSLARIKSPLGEIVPYNSDERAEVKDRSYDAFRKHVRETADLKSKVEDKSKGEPQSPPNDSVALRRGVNGDNEVQRLNRCVEELREHLSDTLTKNEELISIIHEKDMVIASLKRELVCADEKSNHFSGLSTDHERIILSMSNELQDSHEENAKLKREVDEFRLRCHDLESELFKMKDEAIVANSQLTQRASSEVTSEYELLYSILDGLTIGPSRGTSGSAKDGSLADIAFSTNTTVATDNSAQSSHETESEDLDNRQPKDREYAKHSDFLEQLVALEEQLQESTMIIVHREKEISTLIAAQRSFLDEQTYLRKEVHEVRQQKIDAQSQIAEYEEKLRLLKVEVSELKNRLHKLQLENLKYTNISPPVLNSTSSTDLEEFPDSYDYANLPLSEFNEIIIQKLILVKLIILPFLV